MLNHTELGILVMVTMTTVAEVTGLYCIRPSNLFRSGACYIMKVMVNLQYLDVIVHSGDNNFTFKICRINKVFEISSNYAMLGMIK